MNGSETIDAALTGERSEAKFLVPRERALELRRIFDRRMHPHHFRGSASNCAELAYHYITTIYFDTPNRDIFRAATESRADVKIRAREYYDFHPALAELATRPLHPVRGPSALWLELKRRRGGQTFKRRVAISRQDIPHLLCDGALAHRPDLCETDTLVELIDEVRGVLAQLNAPLAPACLVNYRRHAWQLESSALRVTLDMELAWYRPPTRWAEWSPLTRAVLGTPHFSQREPVLEIKHRDLLPGWMDDLVSTFDLRPATVPGFSGLPYSKYIRGSLGLDG